ncbi:hypothetical protein Vretimale_18852 [Volvox reticuliferus]|uniref:Uncharacterized protein n=1 Tax=Volvox reticuliferus TaxID=1737510 RepID=A0A8J4CWG3_9CHLO|nr:hypothetical protein Vretifemale_18890 [Volvox reticuliferus]GIM16180.1 hypothetical protein Vretimale_18852 [Volvox reticuliferus]
MSLELSAAAMAGTQQGDPVNQDASGSNPPGEPTAAGDSESFIMPDISEMMNNIQTFFATQCLTRAHAVEAEVSNLQYEINGVTDRAELEKNEALKELNRLGKLVLNFQSRIAQLLQLDGFGGQA